MHNSDSEYDTEIHMFNVLFLNKVYLLTERQSNRGRDTEKEEEREFSHSPVHFLEWPQRAGASPGWNQQQGIPFPTWVARVQLFSHHLLLTRNISGELELNRYSNMGYVWPEWWLIHHSVMPPPSNLFYSTQRGCIIYPPIRPHIHSSTHPSIHPSICLSINKDLIASWVHWGFTGFTGTLSWTWQGTNFLGSTTMHLLHRVCISDVSAEC